MCIKVLEGKEVIVLSKIFLPIAFYGATGGQGPKNQGT